MYYSPRNLFRRIKIKRNFSEWSLFSFVWKFCGYESYVLIKYEEDMIHMLENIDLRITLIKYYNSIETLVEYQKKQKKHLTKMELENLKRSYVTAIETFREDFQLILERRVVDTIGNKIEGEQL